MSDTPSAEEGTELERLRSENRQLKAKLNCTCGLLRAAFTTRTEHWMDCREYVGPLEHRWINTGINPTFGGIDYWCVCGGWFRQGGMAGHGDGSEDAKPICPHADQDWRGPRR